MFRYDGENYDDNNDSGLLHPDYYGDYKDEYILNIFIMVFFAIKFYYWRFLIFQSLQL